jgi:hypothetical protein
MKMATRSSNVIFGGLPSVSVGENSLIDIWEGYSECYDIEHFYRYGKQRLLMDAYQIPLVENEENW